MYNKKDKQAEEKAHVRKRYAVKVDPENYEFIPAKKQIDYYDNDVAQRVAVYVRVSTDSVKQTTSYELQKKYYEDFVVRHPNWTLVGIYADEGISGTSLAHRDEFNRMILDCTTGKIDMVVTKSVSRFSRNITDCIGIVRSLAEQKHPVGVFFETECIFSLNDDSQMALSFQATMAQEESHVRSRSMETSLRMRLDGGIPLTPKLLGYSQDAEGKLIINPEEAPTVKLIFFMYLYGYSSADIATALTELGRKTYLGNVNWTSSSVVQVLRNERHCGDVLTRKTFTPNYLNHKSRKNRGDRPQSVYKNHHEGIVSRDDYIAVQHMLDNSKYRNKSILPELRVIGSGLLKGFVSINPRWAGFEVSDYFQASESVYQDGDNQEPEVAVTVEEEPVQFSVAAGDFDMRGFEITRSEFFDTRGRPYVTFQDKRIKFSVECVRRFGQQTKMELLVHPGKQQFAARPAADSCRNSVVWSKQSNRIAQPKEISAAAFSDNLYDLFGWNREYKYRATGALYQTEEESAYIFNVRDSEAFLRPVLINGTQHDGDENVEPLVSSGKRVRAIPENWTSSFGKQYYVHQHELSPVEVQSEEEWKIRVEGQLYETGRRLCVTGFDELRQYIRSELSDNSPREENNGTAD